MAATDTGVGGGLIQMQLLNEGGRQSDRLRDRYFFFMPFFFTAPDLAGAFFLDLATGVFVRTFLTAFLFITLATVFFVAAANFLAGLDSVISAAFAPAMPPTTAPTAAPIGPNSEPAAAPAAAPPTICKPDMAS